MKRTSTVGSLYCRIVSKAMTVVLLQRADVLELLREFVPRLAPGVDTDVITPALPLADLGLTSMQVMEVVAELEDALQTQIPLDALTPELQTVDDLVSLVQPHATDDRRADEP